VIDVEPETSNGRVKLSPPSQVLRSSAAKNPDCPEADPRIYPGGAKTAEHSQVANAGPEADLDIEHDRISERQLPIRDLPARAVRHGLTVAFGPELSSGGARKRFDCCVVGQSPWHFRI